MNKIFITNDELDIVGFFEGELHTNTVIYLDSNKEMILFNEGLEFDGEIIKIFQNGELITGKFYTEEIIEFISDELIDQTNFSSFFCEKEEDEIINFFLSQDGINKDLVFAIFEQFSKSDSIAKMLQIFSLDSVDKNNLFFEVLLDTTLDDVIGAFDIIKESKQLSFDCSVSSKDEKFILKVFLNDFYEINKFSFPVFEFLLKGEFNVSVSDGFFVPSWENYNSRIFISNQFSAIFPCNNEVVKVYKCLEFIYLGEKNALEYIFGDDCA